MLTLFIGWGCAYRCVLGHAMRIGAIGCAHRDVTCQWGCAHQDVTREAVRFLAVRETGDADALHRHDPRQLLLHSRPGALSWSLRGQALFSSKVDGFVSHCQHVNLTIVCQPDWRKDPRQLLLHSRPGPLRAVD